MSVSTWVYPGDLIGVVSATTMVLVDRDAAAPLPVDSDALWHLVDANASTADLIECLSGGSLRGMPGFAIASVEDDMLRVTVRGRVVAVVGGEVISAGTAVTWVERHVPMADRIELSVADQELGESSGFLVAGVQRTGALVRNSAGVGATVPSAPTVAPPVAVPAMPSAMPAQSTIAPLGEATLMISDLDESEITDDLATTDIDEDVIEVNVEEASHATIVADEPEGYDHLFGATVRRTVEDAAVRVDEDSVEVVAPLRVPPTPALSTPTPAPVISLPPEADESLLVNGVPGFVREEPVSTEPSAAPRLQRSMITAIPGASAPDRVAPPDNVAPPDPVAPQPVVVAAEPPVAVERDTAVDESTVRRAHLREGAPPPGLPGVNGPRVQAVSCPDGHLNPPYAERCRSCGAPLHQVDPVTVARPALGVLRLSTGESVSLVRPVVMGRSPKANGDVGGEMPLLFTVKSPQSDVSRTHLEIRIDGWHVLVVDLDSANGTTLTIPGQQPRRLHPGEPVALPVGSVVTMADEVSFAYEVS